MTRILLTGINGQVGWELQRSLQPLGEVIALDRTGLDLSNPDRIRDVVRSIKPSIICNPAAYTAVDKAETELDLAMAINAMAPGILAEEARRHDALLIHYSTDYVFDGQKDGLYREDDTASPLGNYGRSKLAGEQAIQAIGCRHLIFRACWVYGLRGHNFLRTILRLASERDQLRIVNDQIGMPTWSRMIADASAQALARHAGQQGIYHLAAPDSASWCDFASAIISSACKLGMIAKPPVVHPITSADYPTPARRPMNSMLDSSRLMKDFHLQLPDWHTQLFLCIDAAGRAGIGVDAMS